MSERKAVYLIQKTCEVGLLAGLFFGLDVLRVDAKQVIIETGVNVGHAELVNEKLCTAAHVLAPILPLGNEDKLPQLSQQIHIYDFFFDPRLAFKNGEFDPNIETRTTYIDKFVCLPLKDFLKYGGTIKGEIKGLENLPNVNIGDYNIDQMYIYDEHGNFVPLKSQAGGCSGGQVFIAKDGVAIAKTGQYLSGMVGGGVRKLDDSMRFYVDPKKLEAFADRSPGK
jgi:hypothetical protein